MDFQMDETRVLYGLGGLLGVAAIIYFGYEIILNLSPTVKSVVLLTGTAGFLIGAELVKNGTLRTSLYVFSAFSYLSFLFYTVSRFEFSSEQIFLVLAGSSIVFILLGYLRSQKDYGLDRDQAEKGLAAIGLFLAALLVLDVTGAQPEYNLELKDEVSVEDGQEFSVGQLEIRNDFVLSRNLDVPTYRGCLVHDDSEQPAMLYINPDRRGVMEGSSSEEVELRDRASRPRESNSSISGTYSIVKGNCPSDPEEDTIYLEESDSFELRRREVRR